MQTDLFAETANTGETPVATDHVTSILGKLRLPFGTPTIGGPTPSLLTYGSLQIVPSDSGVTETRQLSQWTLCLPFVAQLKAVEDAHATPDTRISGVPVILVFATPAWRLLIVSTTSAMPALWGGEHFVSGPPETIRTLNARLLVPPQMKLGDCSNVKRAWLAAALAADAEATSRFVSMVLQLALAHSFLDSRESH